MSLLLKIRFCNIVNINLSRSYNVRKCLQLSRNLETHKCKYAHSAHVSNESMTRLTNCIAQNSNGQITFYREICSSSCKYVNNTNTSTGGVGFKKEIRKKNSVKLEHEKEASAVPRTFESMRIKMRQHHGITDVQTSVVLDKVIEKYDNRDSADVISDNNKHSLKMREHFIASDFSQNSNVSESNDDSEFIANVRSGNFNALSADRDNEAFISMPYGLVRLDSMNTSTQKPKTESISNKVKQSKQTNATLYNNVEHATTDLTNAVAKHDVNVLSKLTEAKNITDDSINADVTFHDKHKNGVNESQPNVFDQEYFSNYVSEGSKSEFINANHTSNYIEDQYFGTCNNNQDVIHESKVQIFPKSESSPQSTKVDGADTPGIGTNVFEEQYFTEAGQSVSDPIANVDHGFNRETKRPVSNSFNLLDTLNSVDDATIMDMQSSLKSLTTTTSRTEETINVNYQNKDVDKVCGNTTGNPDDKLKKTLNKRSSWIDKDIDDGINSIGTFRKDSTENTIFHEIVTKRELKARTRPVADVDNPQTAYDLAVKLRLERKGRIHHGETEEGEKTNTTKIPVSVPRESKWSGKLDGQGFRVLTDQVIDVQRFTEHDIVTVLKDSIIYDDDQVLVIDKPYGLPSHGGPGVHHSVGKLLEPLASRLDLSASRGGTLNLVHRLDKETTGVMILAKGQPVAEMLLAMFKKRQVIKHYWVITKGIPNPLEGVVDIPMGEGTVAGRYRMELRPNYPQEARLLANLHRSDDRTEAITNYRVLTSYGSAAVVECTPETGVKHQIRCHMAFGLNTPILGDHKYSHYSKMAPQKLYPEILQLLGVRQAKVRHIPMHLHAKAIVLPEFKDGRNLFLSARLPKHFVQNMKWLQLKPPQ